VVVALDTFTDTVKTRADMARAFRERALGRVDPRRFLRRCALPAEAAELGRRLRLDGRPDARAGAVMAFGRDAEAEAAALASEAGLRTGGGARRLGGLAGGFSLELLTPDIEWLAVAVPAGAATEADLAALVAEAQARGVRSVFGVLLAG